MKIESVKLSRFELPLVRPLTTKTTDGVRRGIIIELCDTAGNVGFGETSPLPGFSTEDIEQAKAELESLCPHLHLETDIVSVGDIFSFLHSLPSYDTLSPSVRFGVESAFVHLTASREKESIALLLKDQAGDIVYVNALLSGSLESIKLRAKEIRAEGYRSAKLKLGRQKLSDDITLTRDVAGILGDDISLRLDANRAWSATELAEFGDAIGDINIEYIEEPCPLDQLVKTISKKRLCRLAVDEMLASISPENLVDYPEYSVVVLKPTMLGLEGTIDFANAARSLGMKVVISSSFESSVGLTMLFNLAAALGDRDCGMGLDTAIWFESDVVNRTIKIDHGAVKLTDLPAFPRDINRSALTPITPAISR